VVLGGFAVVLLVPVVLLGVAVCVPAVPGAALVFGLPLISVFGVVDGLVLCVPVVPVVPWGVVVV
jgi:hypothetical protein